MSDWPDEIDQPMLEAIAIATAKVHRHYRDWVDRDDLKGELYLFAWKNRKKMVGYLNREDEVERKQGWSAALTALERAGERYARKEKAAKCGYAARDEFFYDSGLIAELLSATENDTRLAAEESGRRGPGNPAEGLNFETMAVDVDLALGMLDPIDRDILLAYHGEGLTAAEIAENWDMTRQAVERKLDRAMTKAIAALGGASPWAS